MTGRYLLNGATAGRTGYWVDGDGHRVFVQRNQLMPSCPAQPFRSTMWVLHTEVPLPRPTDAD